MLLRRLTVLVTFLSLALLAGLPVGLVQSGAQAATPAAAPVPVADGTSEARAAASCWEVKQVAPSSPSGSYWLWTPTLGAPQQFSCDMQTDGGGWVLLGRGREGWQGWYHGQGAAASLLGARTDMSTTQLSSKTVDGLLDGGSVASLTDGLRVKRSLDAAGSSYQEVRFGLPKRTRWSWAFGAANPVGSWSFTSGSSRTAGTGGTTASFGTGSGTTRLAVDFSAAQSYASSFAYGTSVAGSSADTSYLWSATNGTGSARPYSELYVRPRLMSSSFAAVPDSGTAPVTQPEVSSSWASNATWGVSDLAIDYAGEGHVEVQSFAQIGDTVYVAGNFKYVQRGRNATGADKVQQSFVAAFDKSGVFKPGFAPVVNGEVRALAALPGNRLAMGGSFNTLNGEPRTGLAVVDATSGATAAGFTTKLENRVTGGVLQVRSLSVSGDHLYLGGAFTHLTGATSSAVYARNAARVLASTGQPDRSWNPEFNGTVVSTDGSTDGSRLYASGYFTTSGTASASKAAAVQTTAGAALATTAWNPVWSAAKNYQQAIKNVDDRVWVGGSEHSMFSFSSSTFERLSTTITDAGGDLQTITAGPGAVYGGCHCNNYAYQDAATWPSLGSSWTQADKINWIGAWDRRTGSYVPDFSPVIGSRSGAGAWASFVDSDNVLWAGGDLTSARTGTSSSQWVGGFARFPLADHTAPTTPTVTSAAATGETVRLSWTAATDDRSSVAYQVLRDDRVVATTAQRTLDLPIAGNARYFVRAVDTAGNRSASSAVATPEVPTTPVDSEVVAAGSTWSYRYQTGEPAADWKSPSFVGSWPTGAAAIGFGSTGIATNIDVQPTSARPQTAYFRRSFDVPSAAQVASLTLTTRADDGIAVYVNGTEVGRSNLVANATSTTYASSSRRTAAATSAPVTITVPGSLLVDGANVVTAEVHLNYKSAPDLSFELTGTAQYR